MHERDIQILSEIEKEAPIEIGMVARQLREALESFDRGWNWLLNAICDPGKAGKFEGEPIDVAVTKVSILTRTLKEMAQEASEDIQAKVEELSVSRRARWNKECRGG